MHFAVIPSSGSAFRFLRFRETRRSRSRHDRYSSVATALSGGSTDENAAYCRRPPLASALRGRDMFSVELARDLAQALALDVSSADARSQLRGNPRFTTGPRDSAQSRRLPTLGKVTLELGDWDQPCTPLRPHRCDCRDDAAIERCEADADRFGGLLARVGESLDPLGELDIRRRQLPW